MLLSLILGLLAEAPVLVKDVEAALTEIHSKDPTGTKVAKIANDATAIAQIAGQVAATPSGG